MQANAQQASQRVGRRAAMYHAREPLTRYCSVTSEFRRLDQSLTDEDGPVGVGPPATGLLPSQCPCLVLLQFTSDPAGPKQPEEQAQDGCLDGGVLCTVSNLKRATGFQSTKLPCSRTVRAPLEEYLDGAIYVPLSACLHAGGAVTARYAAGIVQGRATSSMIWQRSCESSIQLRPMPAFQECKHRMCRPRSSLYAASHCSSTHRVHDGLP
jgi:hypothetical protein